MTNISARYWVPMSARTSSTFTESVTPALLEMARKDLAQSGFATQADRVQWLQQQAESAGQSVIDYSRLYKVSVSPEAKQKLDQAWRNLCYFANEHAAHTAILRAERE